MFRKKLDIKDADILLILKHDNKNNFKLTSPPLSFIPIIFGWSASFINKDGGISIPVLAGTL